MKYQLKQFISQSSYRSGNGKGFLETKIYKGGKKDTGSIGRSKEMFGLAMLIITCLYLQVIVNRDKKSRKQIQLYNRNVKREEKRRIREDKLKYKRVKHPKVIYLSDYRQEVVSNFGKIV